VAKKFDAERAHDSKLFVASSITPASWTCGLAVTLKSRIDDALARAAVTLGNDSDEYLTRDPEDDQCQNLLGTDIADGQRRLNELGVTIGHIQFLKTALVTRFPDFKLSKHFPRENVVD
jgi:hypothetical protein